MYNEKTFKPIDNMVFVELDPFIDTSGGIILPTETTDRFERLATVLAVGRGYNTITGLVPCNVKVNDKVLVHKKSISPLEHLDPLRFGVMKDMHVMGILDGEFTPEPVKVVKPKKKAFIRIDKVAEKNVTKKSIESENEVIEVPVIDAKTAVLQKRVAEAVQQARNAKKGK